MACSTQLADTIRLPFQTPWSSMRRPKRARSWQVDRRPSKICAFPAASVVIVVCVMPSGLNSRCSANVTTFCAGRPLEDAVERLHGGVVVGPDRARGGRLAEADREGGAVAGGKQADVIRERTPLAAGVHAEQVADGHRLRGRVPPLRDPLCGAVGDLEIAVVLGDPDQCARDRLGDREGVLRRVRAGAAEVPRACQLAVAHDDQAVRLARPRLVGDLVQLRRVEAGDGGSDLPPRPARRRRRGCDNGARVRRAVRGRARREHSRYRPQASLHAGIPITPASGKRESQAWAAARTALSPGRRLWSPATCTT